MRCCSRLLALCFSVASFPALADLPLTVEDLITDNETVVYQALIQQRFPFC